MKNKNIYKIEFPLKRTHAGIPLGNGGMGALVWGSDRQINITVSRNDFWDHRNGQSIRNNGISYKKITEAYAAGNFDKVRQLYSSCIRLEDMDCPSTLLPCGRFELSLKRKEQLREAKLNIHSGKLKIVLESSKSIDLRLSMGMDVLFISDKQDCIESVEGRPAWDFLEKEFKVRLFEAPEIVKEKNLRGWIQNCPADPSLTALCETVDDGVIIALCLGKNAESAKKKALSVINNYKSHKNKISRNNADFWKNYWKDIPNIEIPSEFFNKFVPFAFYKFACAANPSAAKPAPLQGPWIEDYQFPPWGGNYTININIEQIYTLAFHMGKFEFLEPLFTMLESEPFRKVMSENAKSMFGIDDGYLLTHSINDIGMQCQMSFSTHSALDHAVTSWMAQLYWLYFQYTRNKVFLRNRAYPFMLRVLRVYEEMLEEYEGRLSIPLAPSPEYGVSFKVGESAVQEGRDPSMQLACVHMLIDALLEASEILNISPRPIWLDIKKRLPIYTLIDDGDGERIALWEGQDLEVCHRHHSHLGCIYPFDTLGKMDEKKRRIIDNSIDHWIAKGMGQWSEWCMPWAALIQIRLGFSEAPAILLDIWKEVFVNETLASVYLPRFRGISAHRKELISEPREKCEIMQLEGTMATATAVIEMLAHKHSGIVKFFYGIPEKWKDISFSGIRLPGNFIAGASMKNGSVKKVVIKSLTGGEITIDIKGVKSVTVKKHKSEKLPLPCILKMNKNEEVVILPGSEI